MKLNGTLGNINAQRANSHVDLPSKVKAFQTKSSLKDPAGLASQAAMIHYISTEPGAMVSNNPIPVIADRQCVTFIEISRFLQEYSPGPGDDVATPHASTTGEILCISSIHFSHSSS